MVVVAINKSALTTLMQKAVAAVSSLECMHLDFIDVSSAFAYSQAPMHLYPRYSRHIPLCLDEWARRGARGSRHCGVTRLASGGVNSICAQYTSHAQSRNQRANSPLALTIA